MPKLAQICRFSCLGATTLLATVLASPQALAADYGLSASQAVAGAKSFPPAIQVHRTTRHINLAGSVDYVVLPPGAKPQQLTANTPWRRGEGQSLNFGTLSDEVWLRFQITNQSAEKITLYLQQAYTNIDLVELLQKTKTGFDSRLVGDAYPFAHRDVAHRTMVFTLDLAPGKTYPFYMRMATPGAMIVDLHLWEPQQFFQETKIGDYLLVFYYGMMVVIVLYNLLVFSSTRQMEYLYYIGLVFFFMMSMMLLNGHAFEFLWPQYPQLNNSLVLVFFGLFWFFGIRFGNAFLDIETTSPLNYKILQIQTVMALIVTAGGFFLDYQTAITLGIAGAMAATVHSIAVGVYFTYRRSELGLVYLLSWSFFMVGVAIFLLRIKGLVPSNTFTNHSAELGSTLEVILISFGLAERINNMRRQLANLNAELEDRVEERTKELKVSLDEVRALKKKQDGDYFLTSLLIKPLQLLAPVDRRLRHEYINRPFKKFEFRNRKADIGGDFCSVETVSIAGKPYAFFLNADAMGKSIQGAGGAIVLGSYLKSFLTKARLGKITDPLPELWLQTLYTDLQNLYESFDGSMLLSLVAGVIDPETGTMYFFNSEHPHPVLYRDEQASFINSIPETRKIGVPQEPLGLQIGVLELAAGDVLIAGSDGRDEVLLKTGPKSEVNHDHTLFLGWVHKGRGRPDQIAAAIEHEAELRDDLSILSLFYAPDVEKSLQQKADAENKVRSLMDEAQAHKATDNFEALAGVYEEVYQLLPALPNILYELAVAYYHRGNLERAYEFAVGQFLRKPVFAQNLELLISLSKKLDLSEKSRVYAAFGEDHFPESS